MYRLYIEKNTSSKKLLKKILAENKINDDIIYNEYGKPYFKNDEIFFSISHSYDYVVCVISDKEVGVDIQKITYRPRIIKRICSSEEQNRINSPEDFTEMWTKKESYAKFLGLGISYGLKKINTLLNDYTVIKLEDYYITICFGERRK